MLLYVCFVMASLWYPPFFLVMLLSSKKARMQTMCLFISVTFPYLCTGQCLRRRSIFQYTCIYHYSVTKERFIYCWLTETHFWSKTYIWKACVEMRVYLMQVMIQCKKCGISSVKNAVYFLHLYTTKYSGGSRKLQNKNYGFKK